MEEQQGLALLFFKSQDIGPPCFVMRKEMLTIGRNVQNIAAENKVDIDLSHLSRLISRRHVQINHLCGDFYCEVLGKNGVFIDNDFYRAGTELKLTAKFVSIIFFISIGI